MLAAIIDLNPPAPRQRITGRNTRKDRDCVAKIAFADGRTQRLINAVLDTHWVIMQTCVAHHTNVLRDSDLRHAMLTHPTHRRSYPTQRDHLDVLVRARRIAWTGSGWRVFGIPYASGHAYWREHADFLRGAARERKRRQRARVPRKKLSRVCTKTQTKSDTCVDVTRLSSHASASASAHAPSAIPMPLGMDMPTNAAPRADCAQDASAQPRPLVDAFAPGKTRITHHRAAQRIAEPLSGASLDALDAELAGQASEQTAEPTEGTAAWYLWRAERVRATLAEMAEPEPPQKAAGPPTFPKRRIESTARRSGQTQAPKPHPTGARAVQTVRTALREHTHRFDIAQVNVLAIARLAPSHDEIRQACESVAQRTAQRDARGHARGPLVSPGAYLHGTLRKMRNGWGRA